ncbi:hypothetical protein FGO68_gene10388 [Halteria grandinella]|uniref:legumain n=1 Tax=Halteria grandinella TaxID=5974 RepID=A0A8J8NRX4_HALGN|nr:hypothetical protein FGO68_gene10388 [Halteria grandinella]
MVQYVQASDHWAVLVAGSNGFWNYRHQADICHAYQILKKNGIPESNIIVMAYDDIANDPENPIPGKLFNQPNGEDVYAGCQIDYKGDSVTPENFLAILKGDKSKVSGGNGKVVESTAESKVFINFADHGAPGLIAFPNEYLYANDFNATITYMHTNQKYKEMVIYIEACESGSMFEGILADNINVYAITAANAEESSWGTYCPPNDMVHGVEINSCLGDLFSVNWMEDADKSAPSKETLDQQYVRVKNLTAQSHVMRYGDLSFEITNRMRVDHVFEAFAASTGVLKAFESLESSVTPTNFDCLKQLVSTYDHSCGKMDDYSLQFVKYFMYACELSTFPMDKLVSHVKAACSH